MSVYFLAQNVAAVQTVPVAVGVANPIVKPSGLGNTPPTPQTFVLTVQGNGAVSASAQILGSNDGINFVAYGAVIAASSDTTISSQAQVGTACYDQYAAIITAISGTNARATVTMSA